MTMAEQLVVSAAMLTLVALLVLVFALTIRRALQDELVELRTDMERIKSLTHRIETRVQNEREYTLRPKDLGAIHTRINKLAEELAASRAQMSTETRMLSEQLRVLQKLLQRSTP